MASVLKVDKLDPQSGTALEIGSSGDTITIPSGATFTQSGTMNASAITAGTIATARLGSGTASSSTVLYGDQTYKAEPGGGLVLIWSHDTTATNSIEKLNSFSSTYDIYLLTYTNISFSADATDKIFIGDSGGYITANYAYGYFGVKSSATPWENSIGGNYGNMSSSFINSIDSASASEYGMTGQAWIHNPFQAGSATFLNGYSGFRNGANDAWSTISYWWDTNSDASSDRIKFESSTGNFSTYGNYKLYGLVNS